MSYKVFKETDEYGTETTCYTNTCGDQDGITTYDMVETAWKNAN